MNNGVLHAALQPLVDAFAGLRKELETLKRQPGPEGPEGPAGRDASPEAVAIALKADDAFLGAVRGPEGAPGAAGAPGVDGLPGKDGEPGADGVGIDAPIFKGGEIYLKGAIVSAHLGQTFRALKNTYATPGSSEDWERVGLHGFRYCGTFDDSRKYATGDICVKGWGAYLFVDGAFELLAGRGAKGQDGAPGAAGPVGATGPAGRDGTPGRDGRDGSQIIAAEMIGTKAVLTIETAGEVETVDLDFSEAIKEAAAEVAGRMLQEMAVELAEQSRRIRALETTRG